MARGSGQGASEAPTASSGASPSQGTGEGPGFRDNPRRTPTQPQSEPMGPSPPSALGPAREDSKDPTANRTAPTASSAAAHASRRQRDRRAFAGAVLSRFWAKLDGTADAHGARAGGALTAAEQVLVLLRQATSVDMLSRMYEGWTPWL